MGKGKWICFSIILLMSVSMHMVFVWRGLNMENNLDYLVQTHARENLVMETEPIDLQTPCAILMEKTTGKIIFEKNKDEQRTPASVTKVMTLLLIYDALASGKIHLNDSVITSAHAKSMGGSQVFLEEGEVQTVETLIKCIVIASGNDAAVAMAEYIGGTESQFVSMMNEKAKLLGMKHTNFVDCCGLTEDENHYSSVGDIAVMTRELVQKYPEILTYAGIWMEDIVHETKQGSKPFTLTNTNKLLRQYEGCTGLKTGSTSIAKYCLSATATRNQIDLIVVVLGAPDSKTRFRETAALFNYGYSKCRLYQDMPTQFPNSITVLRGRRKEMPLMAEKEFSYLSTKGESFDSIAKRCELPQGIEAPIKKGQVIGHIYYENNGENIGKVDLVAVEDCDKATYTDCLLNLIHLLGTL